MGDAAQTPAMGVKVLQMTSDNPLPPLGEMFGQMRQERAAWSKNDALQHLEANHAALRAAIEARSDEELARPLTLPMRAEFSLTLPLAGWALLPYRTYVARFAQINYIQTLYGDFDGH